MKHPVKLTHMFVATTEKPGPNDIVCDQPIGFVSLRGNQLEILCKLAHVADVMRFESKEIALKTGIDFAKRNKIAMLFPAIIDFSRYEGDTTMADGHDLYVCPHCHYILNFQTCPKCGVWVDLPADNKKKE